VRVCQAYAGAFGESRIVRGGVEAENPEVRGKRIACGEFGAEVYEYAFEVSALPPWSMIAGGEGIYAIAWPHLQGQ
jgi:hypothetical protein